MQIMCQGKKKKERGIREIMGEKLLKEELCKLYSSPKIAKIT
jgi:hypothetical protein